MVGPTEQTGASYAACAGFVGEIGTAPFHPGDAHDPPFAAGIMETPPARSFGVMHTDLYGDVHLPGGIGHTDVKGDMNTPGFGDYPMPGAAGEPGMTPSAFGGIETDGYGDPQMPPALGDIPITPARYWGDIYATVTAEHGGDSHTPPAIGNMYAGLWAGEMLTGVARRFGDMETTCTGEPEMPPVRRFGHTYAVGEMGMGCFGNIPTIPVRSCGEIPITPVSYYGDIHAGLWAGQMLTGDARRLGDMPTT